MGAGSIIDRYNAIGSVRALTDDESRELERAVRRESSGGVYNKWTLDDQRELVAAARVRGGLKAYADRTGRTYVAVQVQLKKIKRQRRQRGIAFVGRFFYDGEVEGDG